MGVFLTFHLAIFEKKQIAQNEPWVSRSAEGLLHIQHSALETDGLRWASQVYLCSSSTTGHYIECLESLAPYLLIQLIAVMKLKFWKALAVDSMANLYTLGVVFWQ